MHGSRWSCDCPIVGPVIRDVFMARIVTYLSLFYRTGVELVLSLYIVERIIDNRAVAAGHRDGARAGDRGRFDGGGIRSQPAVSAGRHPRDRARRSDGKPRYRAHPREGLLRAGDSGAVRRMIIVLQPLLIAVIGGVILMVALAIILPILNIYNSIGVRR